MGCQISGALGALEGRELSGDVAGQDVESDDDGYFRIRRGVAKDRVVSVVDPEPVTGGSSATATSTDTRRTSRSIPRFELVTEVEVTPANANNAEPVTELQESCDPGDEVTVRLHITVLRVHNRADWEPSVAGGSRRGSLHQRPRAVQEHSEKPKCYQLQLVGLMRSLVSYGRN